MSSNLSPGGYVRQGQRSNSPPRSVNVQVAVRCRPLNDREKSHGERSILVCDEGRREVQFCAPGALRKNAVHSSSNSSSGKKTFTYDQVYGPHATQEDVYEGLVEPIVDEVLQGYNCTVFAYGQTGTGKTHTMEGQRDDDMLGVAEGKLTANAGIIPRAVKHVFDHLRNLTDEHSVRVSHLELYNEQLSDLLGPEALTNESLRVYEDSQKGTFVQGLEDVVVRSEDEIFAVLDRSATKRKTAETLMNKYSSRSHSIFSITIHIKESTPEGADLLKVGKLNLVDLAGSENVGRSGAVKGRAREAGNINQSLLTLGRVITALVDRHPHIPYRDSKLTRLLQESLGGRNKTCVIATVTPASNSFEETASTLDYAHRAKSIKNRPTVNQMIAKHVLLKEYTEEISKLKRELDATRAKNGVYLPPEEFEKLQFIGSQQRDTIEQLSAQSEEYERRLSLQKEKLERTQEALARDQRILAATRQSLASVTSELNVTKLELQVTSQQKEENAILVRNHVENERSLHDHGVSIQENLTTCISDTELLHARVSVKDDLERRNLANMTTLKQTVSSGVSALEDTLQKHKLDQQSLLEASTVNLEKLGEVLDTGLKSMTGRIRDFTNDLLRQQDVKAKEEGEMTATFEASCLDNFRSVQDTVASHSDLMEDRERSVTDTCKGISGCFQDSQATVSSIKAVLKQFGAAQKDQFGVLAQEQERILADLNERISECHAQQAELLSEFKQFNEKDSELEVDQVKKMKTEIIESVTSSLDVLVKDTLSRVAKRKESVIRCSEGLLQNAANIDGTVRDIQMSHSSKFQTVQRNMDTQTETAAQQVAAHSERHDEYAEQGTALLGSLQENVTEIGSSFQGTSRRTKAVLNETETLVTTLRLQKQEKRDSERQNCESKISEAHEMLSEASTSLSKSVGEGRHDLKSTLDSIEHSLVASQAHMQLSIASVHDNVEGYNILCDTDRENIPSRRTWPLPKQLPRTRAHSEIIDEMRTERGLGEVPREDFGHVVPQDDKNRLASIADSPQESPCAEDKIREDKTKGEETTEEITTPRENAKKFEESSPQEKSLSPSTSEESVHEDVQTPILSDATNRRPRNRSRKKLEHVIRKKPSALPVPRTRSAARRHGL